MYVSRTNCENSLKIHTNYVKNVCIITFWDVGGRVAGDMNV